MSTCTRRRTLAARFAASWPRARASRRALSARQEVPKPKGNVKRATGSFTATLAKLGTTGTVAWRLRFSGLTGRAIAAHIHIGRVGRAGPVAVALCGPCRNGQRGTANLTAATLAALQAGRGYVNVHTPKNPGGEIRGRSAPSRSRSRELTSSDEVSERPATAGLSQQPATGLRVAVDTAIPRALHAPQPGRVGSRERAGGPRGDAVARSDLRPTKGLRERALRPSRGARRPGSTSAA